MPIIASGGASPDPLAGVLYDVTESFGDGASGAAAAALNGNIITEWAGAGMLGGLGALTPRANPFGIIGGTFSVQLAGGNHVGRYVSLAAVAGRRMTNASDAPFSMPLRRFQVAGSIPATLQPLRQYLLRQAIRATVRGTTPVRWGVQGDGLLFGQTDAGAWWESDPAVSGGVLIPQFRQLNAGATVALAPTGFVLDANWLELGLRYTEGEVPQIEFLVNSQPFGLLLGDAQMPQWNTAVDPASSFGLGLSFNGAVGTTIEFGPARWTVRAL